MSTPSSTTSPPASLRARPRRGARAAVALPALLLLGVALLYPAAGPALAYWTASTTGTATATTAVLAIPTDVVVSPTSGPDVTVTWEPGAAGATAEEFVVLRDDGATVEPACGTSPGTPVATTSCTDVAVPDGTYTYVVVAVLATWTAPSTPSAAVVVTGPIVEETP